MLSKTSFLNVFKQNLLVTPTQGQWQAMQLLSDFVNKVSSENELFILSGYAGTGKTTLVSALVNTLIQTKKNAYYSLRPVGRLKFLPTTLHKKLTQFINISIESNESKIC